MNIKCLIGLHDWFIVSSVPSHDIRCKTLGIKKYCKLIIDTELKQRLCLRCHKFEDEQKEYAISVLRERDNMLARENVANEILGDKELK